MIVQVTTDAQGRFDINPVIGAVVQGGFAQMLYFVSEDLLREAVNRTPIDTGLLRASGSVALDGMPLVEYQQKVQTKRRKTKKGYQSFQARVVVPSLKVDKKTVTAYAQSLALAGRFYFTFSVGFNTPYACVIHEGSYRLGRRSVKATARRKDYPIWTHGLGPGAMQYGKVGPKFLTRAWADNEAKYLTYLRSLGGGTIKVN